MRPAQPYDTATARVEFNCMTASFACTLLSVVYMLQLKPRLLAAGVICVHQVPTEAVDWLLVAALAAYGSTILRWRCAPTGGFARRRKYSLLIVAFAFMAATLKLAVLLCIFGLCALSETPWCVMLGGLVLMTVPRTQLDKPQTGVSFQVAEAEVTKVLAGLEAIAWSDDGTTGGLEHRGSTACAICLGDWESGDVVRVTPCGHAFHQDCLKDWLVSSMCKWKAQSCAVCRRDLLAGTGDAGVVLGVDSV